MFVVVVVIFVVVIVVVVVVVVVIVVPCFPSVVVVIILAGIHAPDKLVPENLKKKDFIITEFKVKLNLLCNSDQCCGPGFTGSEIRGSGLENNGSGSYVFNLTNYIAFI